MTQPHLKITMAQLNPVVGNITGNAQRILDEWERWDEASDLILFPEMFLSGYPPEDLVLNAAFIQNIHESIRHICNASKAYKSACLLPTPWADEAQLYNSVLLIEGGEIIAIQHKLKLPNNFVFDEPRTFQPSPQIPAPINFRGHKLGILICEDMWHADLPMHHVQNGADLMIAINASPFDYTKHSIRLDIAQKLVFSTKSSLLYLNMCGAQDELIFDGRSFIMHSNGQIAHQAPAFEEDIINVVVDFPPAKDQDSLTFAVLSGKDSAHSAPPNPLGLVYKAITTGLHDYVHKNGFKNVLIGLSGGVDSALVAAMAVDALGAQHVRCVMLPSAFTSTDSLEDAKACAQNLGVRYDIIEIKDAVKTFEKLIPDLKGTAHENTQSRIRGTILMALSNISGEMLLTTGNKSEMAVGYATLYGDMNGGYNPLKDLYKTDVYSICAWLNHDKEVIPARIITKAPSAELRPDQTDQDSLPPYELLDNILRCLIEYDNADWDKASPEQIALKKSVLQHPQEVERIARLLKNSEFKRFQAPPGARISYRAFGRDRRYPLTNAFANDIEKDD